LKLAKQDNPEAYGAARDKLKADWINARLTKPLEETSFDHLDMPIGDKMSLSENHDATRDEVEDWMRSCIYRVTGGGKSMFYVRKLDKSYGLLTTPFDTKTYWIWDGAKSKKPTKLYYHEILTDLVTNPIFRENRFANVRFYPLPPGTEIKRRIGKELQTFNNFPGWPTQPRECTRDDAELGVVISHIRDIICNGDAPYFEYLMNWFAHAVQKPFVKIGVVPIFVSGEGAGKNILVNWIREEAYGEHLSTELKSLDEMTARFNCFLENRLLVVLNEVGLFGGNKAQSEKMKSMITEDKRVYEPKGLESYTGAAYENYIMMSNNDYIVHIPKDDRRFAPIQASNARCGDKAYFDRLAAALTRETAEKFLHVLMTRDISGWNKHDRPMTSLRASMIDRSLSAPIAFLHAVADGEACPPLEHNGPPDGEFRMHKDEFFKKFDAWTVETKTNYRGNIKAFMSEISPYIEVKKSRLWDPELGRMSPTTVNGVVVFPRAELKQRLGTK
jgi:hypothetical protein